MSLHFRCILARVTVGPAGPHHLCGVQIPGGILDRSGPFVLLQIDALCDDVA